MKKTKLSAGHSFFLGLMSLMVAVLCITIGVVQENLKARLIMTAIWAVIAIWWLTRAAVSQRRTGDTDGD